MSKIKTEEIQLYSTPVIAAPADILQKIASVLKQAGIADRAEALTQIESGALDHLDVPARVFIYGPNTNFLTFHRADMPGFAASFKGQPYLRNHDQWDIGSRDGTIQESAMSGDTMDQVIRLTTRAGMTAFVEGQIDRFSIGWYKDDVLCTICEQSWFSAGCSHWPGREYETAGGKKTCMLLSVNPKGKETSAVNAPAVKHGTGLLQELEALKLSINGDSADDQQGDQKMNFPRPMFEADKGDGAGAPPVAPPSSAAEQKIAANQAASALLLGEAERQATLNAQLETSQALLIAQCANLLTAGLAGSRLPEVVQTRLKAQFAGKVFEPTALQAAIDGAREEVSALTGGQAVTGPARMQSMFSSEDQIRAALDDLLGAPRELGMETLKVARFTGIREAYLMLTGDREFIGGWFPEFALGTTATFPGIVKDSLNKRLKQAWDKYGEAGYDWWKPITTVEHFDDLNQVDWIRLGTIGSLPTVAEQGEYTELPIGDNVETSDWTKYGGYVGLTLEAILRDNIRAFLKLPDQIAMGALRNISEQIAAIFTQASGAGPTLADTGALFNATAVTTAGGHANLLTTALGTDYVAWNAAAAALYNLPMHIKNATGYYGTGKKQAIDPKFCLVPRALKIQAESLFIPRFASPIESIQTAGGTTFGGYVTPITVPEWTDATDWAAVIDPALVPGIMLGEIFGLIPKIYIAGNETDPAFFANDESRMKVRQFLTVGIANWSALHKSNVA